MELGPRVRALRQRADMTQVKLAERLGISASYLNLIEHGNRPLPAHLLIKLARVFDLDLDAFGADEAERVTSAVDEALSDPVFDRYDIAEGELADFTRHSPGMAEAFVTLFEAYRDARESLESLSSRVSAGPDVPGVEPWRLPSEEVSELLQRNQNHFADLELAAEELWREADLETVDLFGGLRRYLADVLDIRVRIEPAEVDSLTVRRFDERRRELILSEILEPNSVVFQVAHQIGLLTQGTLLDRYADDGRIKGPDSRALARVALANYFAGAVLMPYARFAKAARELRYDVDLLCHRFGASFEQVCHRLTTLRRPGDEGIPFHFIRVDIAGNISKRFSASGISFARFSGACPRWNLVNCFLTPGQIRTQLSEMPDGREYFCIARTVSRGERGFGRPPAMHAVCLGCTVEHAEHLVYADGMDLTKREAAVPVGVTCRICERMDCEQRAFPPLQRTLEIDENVRAQSFYASLRD